jgi:predicted DNA-binding transcriptional regulator AlpA
MATAVLTLESILGQLFLAFFAPLWVLAQALEPKEKSASSRPAKRAASKNIRRPIMFRPELLELFKCSAPTIWLWQVKHNFPRPIVVAGRSAWFVDEVEQWISTRPRRRIKGDAAPIEELREVSK